MKKIKITFVVYALLAAMLLYACGKEGNNNPLEPPSSDNFKSGMLVNYADNIIIPAYTDLQGRLAQLEGSVNSFSGSPSGNTQQQLKESFKAAYLSYQNVSVAYFGPASALLLNNYLNTFPAATLKIESAIQSGVYDFSLPVASDSIQGFPALDYLLFSSDAVQKFATAGATSRIKYVKDIIVRMRSLVSNALTQWNSSYRTTFVASLKTNVGSSIGNLVNQFAFEMDALKGPRIGWPFGKQSNGIVFADKCEGYYAGFSGALALANLASLKNYYVGAGGSGIADYLVLLKKDQLNNDVLAQFDIARVAITAIPDPMSAVFTSNPPLIETAYKEVQKLLTLIKTDVASATAVQITYMDNDGD